MILKWTEMMWLLEDPDNPIKNKRLGEAGNPSYPVEKQCSAIRIGDEVLVCGGMVKETVIISADISVEGFGPLKDGKTLKEIMIEERYYDFMLN